MILKKSTFFFTLLVIMFSSCSSNPNIKLEDLGIVVPESWTTSLPDTEEIVGDWWLIFQDSLLIKYLDDFNKNSPDVLTLLQNQKVAKNTAKISSSSIFPQINFT